jgi:hypothetical protein
MWREGAAERLAEMVEPSEIAGILDKVARGNRDAFREIVRAYSLPLRRYLASHGRLDELPSMIIRSSPRRSDGIMSWKWWTCPGVLRIASKHGRHQPEPVGPCFAGRIRLPSLRVLVG